MSLSKNFGLEKSNIFFNTSDSNDHREINNRKR